MRIAAAVVIFWIAVAAVAGESDLHQAAVLDRLLREIPAQDRAEVVFVRLREQCWDDPSRREGCADLTDEALDFLRHRGHSVSRVPEGSRYYIYGHPSTHAGSFNVPPPDWLYLPIYTPAAEWRTYCEVEMVRGLHPGEARHVNGRCYAADREIRILAGGDFLVKRAGEGFSVEPFEPPPGCILPAPKPLR